ncbi:hypothetical protein MMC24_001988 [Lignoscripta atroalba]|nr:hypothetical protein [Lignoscripta atroalba]
MADSTNGEPVRETRILPIKTSNLGHFSFSDRRSSFLGDWEIELDANNPDAAHLLEAAQHLRTTNIPVAFPTETVYGLGADATRSSAVLGIYAAKQRPADNPLIVHICSLTQLRSLLRSHQHNTSLPNAASNGVSEDPIPLIYHPLIQRFWPGPLTILLPNPPNSLLAPEVTAGLPTFGARMPSSLLALALIKTANIPLAAPSANASTKPSPTTAQHVKHDLDGRIEIILDGGPCEVGVESTVVDGLSTPPSILRPGGVSISQLRECPGWEDVIVSYKDGAEKGKTPRAPGMKYKHYSPRARVVLFEADVCGAESLQRQQIMRRYVAEGAKSIGILRTKRWKEGQLVGGVGDEFLNNNGFGFGDEDSSRYLDDNQRMPQQINGSSCRSNRSHTAEQNGNSIENGNGNRDRTALPTLHHNKTDLPPRTIIDPQPSTPTSAIHYQAKLSSLDQRSNAELTIDVWDIGLGSATADIARGLFSALRELDSKGVDVIFVEGIDDGADDGGREAEGETAAAAAAVMNRLRKAAEVEIKS